MNEMPSCSIFVPIAMLVMKSDQRLAIGHTAELHRLSFDLGYDVTIRALPQYFR